VYNRKGAGGATSLQAFTSNFHMFVRKDIMKVLGGYAKIDIVISGTGK